MRRLRMLAVALLSVAASHGGTNVAGLTFAGGTAKATQEVREYYDEGAAGKECILKRYDSATKTWVDFPEAEYSKYADKSTYVISHGLNSGYDSTWISDSAKAIANSGSDALIISINWDHYSGYIGEDGAKNDGRSNDSNFAASTWINAVSTVVAEKLGNFPKIKSFVGHSYGAHLEAATMVKMSDSGTLSEKPISFVALDPAEETLTFSGDKDGNSTWMWSDSKKSKNWNLPSNVTSETYKSSGFLGSEERLGDYNYFLAEANSITPRGMLGDLDSGIIGDKNFIYNHSVAPNWFADFLENYLQHHVKKGGYSDPEMIGGWFKDETDASRKDRVPNISNISRTDKGWDGVVNANSTVKGDDPHVEYLAGNEVYTEWQDMTNAEAQELLYRDLNGKINSDKSNWKGTVLKENKYEGYRIFHGNDANKTNDNKENGNHSGGKNSQTTAGGNGDSNGGIGNGHATSSTTHNESTTRNGSSKQDGSSPTTNYGQNGSGQNTTGGNNSSTDQSGIAEWRKIAYEVLTGKNFPDGDNTGPTTADGQNTGNSSDDGNSGNNKGQNSPNGGNVQDTGNSGTNGSGSGGQSNNTKNKNDQNANGQNNGSNADGKNGKGQTTDSGISGAGTTTENGRTGENGKSSDKDVPKNPVVATTQDDFVDMGTSNGGKDGNSGMDALAQQMLKEYLTGESQVLSPDFIPGAFGSLSSDPQKAETIANEAFGHAVDSVVSDGAVSQAIKDFMSQGGDVQQTLSSFLDGKVTEDQKSQILTLSDALGKVGEDGGKSLINALGDQGAQLADSLVINEIKNQLLSSLPKDQAEQLNAIIGALDARGLSAETKQKIADVVQDLVSKTLPNYSAETINGLIQDIVDGNSIDKLDTVKDLGKSITADALKAVLKNNLDPKLAGKINSLIDGYMKNGAQGLSEAALKELNALIDQYAPGANTAKLLKDTVNGIVSGTANPADWKDVATSVVSDAANKLIDESNLPQDVKDAAKAAVNGLAQNGLTGLTTNMRDFISDYVSDKLGSDEAGEAVGKIFDSIITPGVDPWQEIVKQAPVIGMALAEKCLAEAEKLAAQQIDKLIAKYPNVKKVLDKLGINGAGVVQGVVNVLGVLLAAPNLSTAITQLSAMAVNFLKNIAAKLIDWALEWAVSWLNNTLMPKVLTWASNTLEKWADSVDNDLIKKGLEYLKQQCENCKKQGGIKIKTAGTGKKVVDYVDDLIKKRKKSQSGTTVLKSK